MKKAISVAVASVLLFFLWTSPAQAEVANWSANGESGIVDHTTVRLQGANTSVETGNLNINVNEGDPVSFTYELVDGALCEAGAPRLFLVINGAAPPNNKSDDCDGVGKGDTTGVITFNTDRAGLISAAGLVYDSGRPGHVLISNLTVGDKLVLFQEPPVTPEPTETASPSPSPSPSVNPTPTAEPSATPEPTEEPVPVSKQLPQTGNNTLIMLLLIAAGLGVSGTALLLVTRRRRVTS